MRPVGDAGHPHRPVRRVAAGQVHQAGDAPNLVSMQLSGDHSPHSLPPSRLGPRWLTEGWRGGGGHLSQPVYVIRCVVGPAPREQDHLPVGVQVHRELHILPHPQQEVAHIDYLHLNMVVAWCEEAPL